MKGLRLVSKRSCVLSLASTVEPVGMDVVTTADLAHTQQGLVSEAGRRSGPICQSSKLAYQASPHWRPL